MDRQPSTKSRRIGLLIAVAAVAAAVTLVFLGERMASGILAERRSIEASAANKLLYDSEFLARSLDGLLRLSDAAALDVSDDFAPPDRRSDREAAAAAAMRVPESQNAYVLTSSGAVSASAWPRSSPSLVLPEGVLDRLLMTGKPESLVAEAPAEGGTCLAVVSPMEGRGRFLAIVFSASTLEGRTSLLKEEGEEAASVRDASSRVLGQGAGTAAAEGNRKLLISAETALAYHPLKVRIERDLGPALDQWRSRLAREAVYFAVLVLAWAALFLVALVTKRRAARNEALELELRSKELLFHEANHRIKNNLSVVRSILDLGQSQVVDDPTAAKEALSAASERIGSIAMLHEILYKSRSFDEIDLGAYLSELCAMLAKTYLAGRKIVLEARVPPGIKVDFKAALPLVLVVTELVTNACKYAFPDEGAGTIAVSASPVPGGGLSVRVEDDGAWDGSSAGGRGETGFGSDLVAALLSQLGARIGRTLSPAGHGLSCLIEVLPQDRGA